MSNTSPTFEVNDLPAVATALRRGLYAARLPVTPELADRFAQALTLVQPTSRSRLYHTARTVFVSAPAHLPVFDRVFAAVLESCAEDRPFAVAL